MWAFVSLGVEVVEILVVFMQLALGSLGLRVPILIIVGDFLGRVIEFTITVFAVV